MTRQQAISMVAKAVREGRLPRVSTQVCVDCGKQAQAYDHRRYSAPLDVVPVCTPCNFKRGPAEDAGPSTLVQIRMKPEHRVAIDRMAEEDGEPMSSILRRLGVFMARLPYNERRVMWDTLIEAANRHDPDIEEAAA